MENLWKGIYMSSERYKTLVETAKRQRRYKMLQYQKTQYIKRSTRKWLEILMRRLGQVLKVSPMSPLNKIEKESL